MREARKSEDFQIKIQSEFYKNFENNIQFLAPSTLLLNKAGCKVVAQISDPELTNKSETRLSIASALEKFG